MGKWNCRGCGTNLEQKRDRAEFPLVDDAAAIYCRECAKKVKRSYIKCECCGKQVPAFKSLGGKYCNGTCEMVHCQKRMREGQVC